MKKSLGIDLWLTEDLSQETGLMTQGLMSQIRQVAPSDMGSSAC